MPPSRSRPASLSRGSFPLELYCSTVKSASYKGMFYNVVLLSVIVIDYDGLSGKQDSSGSPLLIVAKTEVSRWCFFTGFLICFRIGTARVTFWRTSYFERFDPNAARSSV